MMTVLRTKSATQPFNAIVLCGGKSTRMGRDKAWLRFGEQTFLQLICETLAARAANVVVVSSANQQLPLLSESVGVVEDQWPEHGPLAALLTGLNTMASRGVAALPFWLTSCDMPFCRIEVVSYLQQVLGDHDAVLVRDADYLHPFNAVYQPTILPAVARLFQDGQRSMKSIVNAVDARYVTPDELREVDPELMSLMSVNTPAAFDRAERIYNQQQP